MLDSLLKTPKREYFIFLLIGIGLVFNSLFPQYWFVLLTAASFGAYPTLLRAFASILEWNLTIEVFNFFALVVVFSVGDMYSASFIVLMLSFARILEWRTKTKTSNAVEELLKNKPQTALRENGSVFDEISIARVRVNDILIVKAGEQIPVDSVIIFGKTEINEALVTGESLPIEKNINDEVLAGTVNISNAIKIRATRIGKESTLERMAVLIESARKNKSKIQRFADVFASYFFPIVLVVGLGLYLATKDIKMTVALFLVVCADDIAVAIPLATTAAYGYAAKRGIIIKNGEALSEISKAHIIVLDKTGTLTYGDFTLKEIHREEGISKDDFWQAVAVGEKYSEHPVGKALFREAIKHILVVPNAQKYQVYKGAGVYARYGKDDILLGNDKVLKEHAVTFPRGLKKRMEEKYSEGAQSIVYIAINGVFVGYAVILDAPREGIKESLVKLKALGIKRIIMLTGDKKSSAEYIAGLLGIKEYYAEQLPEDKLKHIEALSKEGGVIMIGDGINDAPALARANVGIAMGKGGSAVTSETADIVMLNDNLNELPSIIELAQRTSRVMYGDIALWAISNTIGFILVIAGFMGPTLAALYNFLTDFFPILNSTRLFADRKIKDVL